jgi:hypothetical protein
VAGLKPHAGRAEYTTEQLIQLDLANIAFADWYLARLSAACDVLAQRAEGGPDARYEALRLKAAQANTVYATVTGQNPFVQVLNLQVLVELTHLKWVEEGKAIAVFGQGGGKLLVDALDEMQKRGRANALRVISQHELDAIGPSARNWRNANLQISDIEFIRFEDFATELAHSLAPEEQTDLMSSIQSAANGITEARLLGVRALGLASRFPRMMQWQIEAQMADAARLPETRSLLADLSQMTKTADQLNRQTAQLQKMLDSFPQKLADSLMGAPAMKQALSAANSAVNRADAATTELAAVDATIKGLGGTVATLTRRLDRINQDYDPAALQKMALETKLGVASAVRSLVYLSTACIAALVVLNAVVRRWRRRPLDVKLTRAPHPPSPQRDLHGRAPWPSTKEEETAKAPRREESH